MKDKVYVIGVGMTRFLKPGSRDWDYPEMAKEAVTMALADAGVSYEQVEHAVAGYVYGDSTSGQRALYEVGLTGIPIYNTNNNCSTGSSALYIARQLIEGGMADCALAIGFEKMQKGSLPIETENDRHPLQKHVEGMAELVSSPTAPVAPWMFGNAGREHMDRYGSRPDHFAWIGWKNHKHSANNPFSQFQQEYSPREISASSMIYAPLTKLQCSPTSDGSAAAVLASERFVRKHDLADQAVEIIGQSMVTDTPETFSSRSCIGLVGYHMTKLAAESVYEQSGFGAEDVDVIELHDCFSTNELITYEALGLCDEGKGALLVDEEATTYGGRWVVNPSGGLISKGHPLGATGLAQCAELNWQLRGLANDRQVQGAKIGLQHNIGLGGAAVVTMYRKSELS